MEKVAFLGKRAFSLHLPFLVKMRFDLDKPFTFFFKFGHREELLLVLLFHLLTFKGISLVSLPQNVALALLGTDRSNENGTLTNKSY